MPGVQKNAEVWISRPRIMDIYERQRRLSAVTKKRFCTTGSLQLLTLHSQHFLTINFHQTLQHRTQAPTWASIQRQSARAIEMNDFRAIRVAYTRVAHIHGWFIGLVQDMRDDTPMGPMQPTLLGSPQYSLRLHIDWVQSNTSLRRMNSQVVAQY